MRKAMVTRTIESTVLTIMVVDTNKGNAVTTIKYEYTGSDEKQEKIFKSISLPDGVLPVQILNKEKREQLYGMYEEDFIKYAVPMNSRFEKI